MNAVELKDVTKSVEKGFLKRKIILDKINLTIREGDVVLLTGESGVGKSTLIKIILGLLKPDSGNAQLYGESPSLAHSKLHVGTVFQEVKPPNSLTVKELISVVHFSKGQRKYR